MGGNGGVLMDQKTMKKVMKSLAKSGHNLALCLKY